MKLKWTAEAENQCILKQIFVARHQIENYKLTWYFYCRGKEQASGVFNTG